MFSSHKAQRKWLYAFVISLSLFWGLALFQYYVSPILPLPPPSPTPTPIESPSRQSTPAPTATRGGSPAPTSSPLPSPVFSSPPPTPGEAGPESGPSETGKGLTLLTILSVLSTIGTLGGFLSSTIITWKKDRRERADFDLERDLKKTQLEKARLELEEIKARQAGQRPANKTNGKDSTAE